MEVIDAASEPSVMEMRQLPPGRVFRKTGKEDFGSFYIRTDNWVGQHNINAVNLGSGVLIRLAANARVLPVDAVVNIKP